MIGSVHRSIRSSLALSGLLLLPLLLVSSSPAQISSASSSSSAHSGGVASASVSSVTHNGYVPSSSGASHPTIVQHFPGGSPNTSEHHRPHHGANSTAFYPYLYEVPFPYAVDVSDADASNNDDNDDSQYQGGPTVFDRRGSGAASYVSPHYEGPAHASQEQSARTTMEDESAPDPEPPPSPTILVFKDGHELEVENYAIVAQTLYDLTPGHPRKIALSELDLPATQKHNDDRGVPSFCPRPAREIDHGEFR